TAPGAPPGRPAGRRSRQTPGTRSGLVGPDRARRAPSRGPGRLSVIQPRLVQLRGRQDGTVDADPPVAAPGANDTSEARAEAARHRLLERELGRHRALGAEAAHAFEHR